MIVSLNNHEYGKRSISHTKPRNIGGLVCYPQVTLLITHLLLNTSHTIFKSNTIISYATSCVNKLNYFFNPYNVFFIGSISVNLRFNSFI